jgi:large subunit ribosomal protein L22
MEAVAKLNNCPVSARKMRLLANQIRGMQVDKALNTLKFNQRRQYAIRLEKLLVSAINNWEKKNEGQSIADSALFIKTVFVDGGPMLKRISPAPQGRAYRVRKRSNHVTLIVDTKEEKN